MISLHMSVIFCFQRYVDLILANGQLFSLRLHLCHFLMQTTFREYATFGLKFAKQLFISFLITIQHKFLWGLTAVLQFFAVSAILGL